MIPDKILALEELLKRAAAVNWERRNYMSTLNDDALLRILNEQPNHTEEADE